MIKPVEAGIGAMATEYYTARTARRKQHDALLVQLPQSPPPPPLPCGRPLRTRAAAPPARALLETLRLARPGAAAAAVLWRPDLQATLRTARERCEGGGLVERAELLEPRRRTGAEALEPPFAERLAALKTRVENIRCVAQERRSWDVPSCGGPLTGVPVLRLGPDRENFNDRIVLQVPPPGCAPLPPAPHRYLPPSCRAASPGRGGGGPRH